MQLTILNYQEKHAPAICQLFYHSINSIDCKIYTEKQKNAWCSSPPDPDKWHLRLKTHIIWVALNDDRVVGFLELAPNGYIHCLFVHPQFQGQGVAAKLYQSMLEWVQQHGVKILQTHASKVAMPVFKKWGFNITKKNFIQRENEVLINYTMTKAIF